MPPACSAENDKCTTATDCCAQKPALSCIGGFCASVVPQ
jgi:hypothetical protein